MNYFSGIRVGDKIWTIQEGWTEVDSFNRFENTFMTIRGNYFNMNGRFHGHHAHQSAFWSDPQIVAPPRPKRMKKVKVEVRPYISYRQTIRLYPNDSSPLEVVEFCGPVQTVEIEVEDD